MSSTSGAPDGPVSLAQLNGWKEIAAYLGRSVRTVQRWEKDFGLPVRRFGVSKPESVFALQREMDAWLLSSQGISARSGAGAPESPGGSARRSGDSAAPPDQRSVRGRLTPLRIIMAALGVAAVAIVVWEVWANVQRERRSTPPTVTSAAPAEWHVDLDTLVVTDSRRNVLWRHRFPRELTTTAYAEGPRSQRSTAGGIADVDGDGSREVWFIAKTAGPSPEFTLYLFEQDGRVRWTYRPTLKVRFGGVTFGPTWLVDRAFLTADPAGGAGRAIWAVLFDTALFPSSIQRLDPATGTAMSAYWTNGSIVTAVLDTSTVRPRLLVGACYNETRAGSLSVLDALDPNGSAPAGQDKYRCMDCPPGEPEAFLVFPKPERFRAMDATGPVEIITPKADGTLGIRVRYTADDDTFAVGVIALDASLAPIAADTADDYLQTYRALAEHGHVRAGAPDAVDPDREFFPLLRWDRAARRYVEVFRRR